MVQLLGHYMGHSQEELSKIGVSSRLLLQYVNERYPRLEEQKPLWTAFVLNKDPLCALLKRNGEKNDGFSGYQLRTLPALFKRMFQHLGTLFLSGASEPNHWWVTPYQPQEGPARLTRGWAACRGAQDTYCDRFGYQMRPTALIADGTFWLHPEPEERLAYEIGAALALVAGGVWKRHATADDKNYSKPLPYIGWHEVKQQLIGDGRGELADLFDAFFSSGKYRENIDELVDKINERDWGFADKWHGMHE
jgi:hypothetical protein